MSREVSERVREKIARRDASSEKMAADLLALIERAELGTVREVATLLIEEVGYLGEHVPDERESIAPFACSDNTYHYCSFTTPHDPGCPAVGGDGTLTNGYDNARPCAPDCGETEPKQWCQTAGFDCPTCELVDKLLGILAREDEA